MSLLPTTAFHTQSAKVLSPFSMRRTTSSSTGYVRKSVRQCLIGCCPEPLPQALEGPNVKAEGEGKGGG